MYETGILNPLNKFVFLEYTVAQWIFMILVVLGLGFVIGEILVSGNIKDTLKSTAKYFSDISGMKEEESEQFMKDVLGQTKSKIKEDVFGDKEIPGLEQLSQVVSAATGKQVNITKQEVKEKRRLIAAVISVILAFVAMGCYGYNIYVLLNGTDEIMANFVTFHNWLEEISFFAGYGALGLLLALIFSAIARRKAFSITIVITIIVALSVVSYINWLRPADPWLDPYTSAWMTGGALKEFKVIVGIQVFIIIGSWLLGTVVEVSKLKGLARLNKTASSAVADMQVVGMQVPGIQTLGMQVNLTKKEIEEKIKSLNLDPEAAKRIFGQAQTYWKKFLSFTGLDRLSLIGKLALIFICIAVALVVAYFTLGIWFNIILSYSIINLWMIAYIFLPLPVYLLVAKRKKNAHTALYCAVAFDLGLTLLNLVILYDDTIKNSVIFEYLPVINDTLLLSCFVAGIIGILVLNALKYQLFPQLKVYQLFGKENQNEIIVFKKTGAEYVPAMIKAFVYSDRIEMLKGEEMKTIYSKANLSKYLYGDLLLVVIDDTFEDIIPVPVPQLSADFNYSPELADLVTTTSSFIDTSITRSKEILNKIKDISNSGDDVVRDFIKTDFANFKKKFLDLDIPIESFQKIVNVNLAKKYHRPVIKKVIIKAQQQVVVSSMLDTGAEISLISERLAKRIGAMPVSSVSISGIEDGMINAPLVHVTIIIDGKEAPIEAAVFPIDKQIGNDLLLDRSVYHWANEQKIGFQEG